MYIFIGECLSDGSSRCLFAEHLKTGDPHRERSTRSDWLNLSLRISKFKTNFSSGEVSSRFDLLQRFHRGPAVEPPGRMRSVVGGRWSVVGTSESQWPRSTGSGFFQSNGPLLASRTCEIKCGQRSSREYDQSRFLPLRRVHRILCGHGDTKFRCNHLLCHFWEAWQNTTSLSRVLMV